MSAIRVLSLPCVDEESADAFAAWLRGEEVAVTGTNGRYVRVPMSRLPFAWDVASEAVEREWADDAEVCAVVAAFLAEAGAQ